MPPAPDRPVVIFDGVCNLCNRAVQFILDHDRRGRMLLAANQSDAGRALLDAHGVPSNASATGAPETLFLVENGRVSERSTAVLRIARLLGFPWSLAYAFVIVPRFLRDAIYRFIARNRYRWFGKRDACRLARPGELERFLT